MKRWFLLLLILALHINAEAATGAAYIRLTPADSKKVFKALSVEIKDEVKVIETNDGALKCGEYNHIFVCELLADLKKTEAVKNENGSVRFGGKLAAALWSKLLVVSTARPGAIVKNIGGVSCSKSPRGGSKCLINQAFFELE